jgi:hypothetical protein
LQLYLILQDIHQLPHFVSSVMAVLLRHDRGPNFAIHLDQPYSSRIPIELAFVALNYTSQLLSDPLLRIDLVTCLCSTSLSLQEKSL